MRTQLGVGAVRHIAKSIRITTSTSIGFQGCGIRYLLPPVCTRSYRVHNQAVAAASMSAAKDSMTYLHHLKGVEPPVTVLGPDVALQSYTVWLWSSLMTQDKFWTLWCCPSPALHVKRLGGEEGWMDTGRSALPTTMGLHHPWSVMELSFSGRVLWKPAVSGNQARVCGACAETVGQACAGVEEARSLNPPARGPRNR